MANNYNDTASDMDVSILFFSSDSLDQKNMYESVLAASASADRLGYKAVWLPERHFNRFGGLFPNPATVASALAVLTKQIRLRAGSVVMPINDPIRVAEEWAVVDQLSDGRVDLAFAQGWNPNDYSLAPDQYSSRLEKMYQGIQQLQCLWFGEGIKRRNGQNEGIVLETYPKPVQQQSTFWLTCVGSNDRFIEAGRKGMNVLTALLFQSLDELKEKIELYKDARVKSGFDREGGEIALMLHTLAAPTVESCIDLVKAPLKNYLRHSIDLWKDRFADLADLGGNSDLLIELAFQRYFQVSGFFGGPDEISNRAEEIKQTGVTEIACLIDFGVGREEMMSSLEIVARALWLKQKREEFA